MQLALTRGKLSCPLSWRFCGSFPSLHCWHVRSGERLSLCCVSMVMLIPAGRNIICSQVEKCFFPPVFPLHLNPGLVVSGFILTLPVSRGVWEGPDPVAFLQVRVFMKQREAGVRGCGCLRSEGEDLESVCQPSVLPPWLSPSAQSWGESCEPPICWNLGL